MRYDPDDCWVIEDADLAAGEEFAEDALVVLLAAGVLIPLNGGDAGICLQVICSDTFAYACADSERVPPIGFGKDMDEPFWDLWRRWKANRTWGPVQWVALRRNQRPLSRIVEMMKQDDAWPPEMEAL